jgi:hypothetical protein
MSRSYTSSLPWRVHGGKVTALLFNIFMPIYNLFKYAFSATQTIERKMNDELGRIWKEAIVV